MKTGLLSTAYFPPISWWQAALKFDKILLEKRESWQRRSYRNRCEILGANGRFPMSIPIKQNEGRNSIDQVEINYGENWRHTHWQAIRSAYNGTPFFESISFELEQFFQQKPTNLFDWNLELIEFVKTCLQADFVIDFTAVWEKEIPNDFRNSFLPNKNISVEKPYPQFFGGENFESDLSILDLLCNEGPAARAYLLS